MHEKKNCNKIIKVVIDNRIFSCKNISDATNRENRIANKRLS